MNHPDFTPQFLSSHSDKSFNHTAIELFHHQYEQNIVYKNYCNSLGKKTDSVLTWQDIPAVPTDVFKLHETPLISFPENEKKYTFTTSGTTRDIKGHHHFPSLSTYEDSIIQCWQQLKLPKLTNTIILTQHPKNAPHSSLSYMMYMLVSRYDKSRNTTTWAINTDGSLNMELIRQTIQKAQTQNTPVAILGTALAFLHIFDQLDGLLILPELSWAMETGGYKGSHRHLEKSELYSLFHQKLGLKTNSVINEYSMTELSSQFYTQGIDGVHTGPHWTRIRVIDPLTEKDAATDQAGHLIIYDLANIHSVLAIRTQDIAIQKGPNSFSLLGRDPSALPRGCSRAADESLQS